MSRHAVTAAWLAWLGAGLMGGAYALVAMAQNPDHPEISGPALAAAALLVYAVFVVTLALWVAAQACHVPQLARRTWLRALERYRIRRAVRERRRRHRARAQIGGVR